MQTAATQISSGANPANRPWSTLVDARARPAAQLDSFVRIPPAGPEDDWAQSPGAAATLKGCRWSVLHDRTTLGADRIGTKPEVVATQVAKGGAATQYPFISVCRDTSGASLGYFATTITYTGTSGTDMVYSIPSAALPKAASTTTVASSAATVEAGDAVTLHGDG